MATWEGREYNRMWCRLFPGSLTANATDWFLSLEAGSISTFFQLSEAFVVHYIHQRREEADISSLFNMHQSKDESLWSFVTRLKNKVLRTNNEVTDSTAVIAF
ncbi:hypothetical protein FRX31_013842 [Thalictrum thalictroides]|uniref:Retrotransposon gag domain-containing protein n=1 Tax=Thalictrum thalictroides TaxID=46969 RepID=A0A7J6WGV5_THATH|nr:hypothetical protein FRX31_013842 [Thalictrum thalictroides]